MKRVQVNLTDSLEEKVRLFMTAEGIDLWAKGILKLTNLGIDNYCEPYKKDIERYAKRVEQKIDNVAALLNRLVEALKIITRN